MNMKLYEYKWNELRDLYIDMNPHLDTSEIDEVNEYSESELRFLIND